MEEKYKMVKNIKNTPLNTFYSELYQATEKYSKNANYVAVLARRGLET